MAGNRISTARIGAAARTRRFVSPAKTNSGHLAAQFKFSTFTRCKGFTLIELLVVLAVIVLGFSVAAFNFSSAKASLERKAAVRDVVSALRYARGQALMSHKEMTVSFDLATNSYTVSGRDKIYKIPLSVDLTIVTAESELTGKGKGSFRFYPDGSSSGGRILMENGGIKSQIDISWLTGHARVENVSVD